MKVVVTSAEPLAANQRAVIAAAFGAPVRETYGMTENVAAASECEAGRLHQWPEVGLTETQDEEDRKSTRLNSSHITISYAVFCLKKKNLLGRRDQAHHRAGRRQAAAVLWVEQRSPP